MGTQASFKDSGSVGSAKEQALGGGRSAWKGVGAVSARPRLFHYSSHASLEGQSGSVHPTVGRWPVS